VCLEQGILDLANFTPHERHKGSRAFLPAATSATTPHDAQLFPIHLDPPANANVG
jgi:hypothetical protein